MGETRKLGCLSEGELDRLLGHFFATVRKDGALYEPDTLSAFQRSIDRRLTQDLKKTYSILRDPCFTSSRQALKASRKYLRAQGKGNKPNASEGLQSSEIERLWDSGALGDGDPQTLQCTIWWLISTQMGTRGCDEHHKFRTLPSNNHPTDQSMLSCAVNEAQRHALGRLRGAPMATRGLLTQRCGLLCSDQSIVP